jgi:hypothetical protein
MRHQKGYLTMNTYLNGTSWYNCILTEANCLSNKSKSNASHQKGRWTTSAQLNATRRCFTSSPSGKSGTPDRIPGENRANLSTSPTLPSSGSLNPWQCRSPTIGQSISRNLNDASLAVCISRSLVFASAPNSSGRCERSLTWTITLLPTTSRTHPERKRVRVDG